ncbi:MAG: BlaI/MecI/CopY family transcriptional regulator [Oscillospiraceae bacterium]|nr:BlaI/MecI/CopY family transcriptional regulator [Oscillospiraceae bacterium]
MTTKQILTDAEQKLARLIWREAPLASPKLVDLAKNELGWKKSTTYTVLKKLCTKGFFKNENANVSVVVAQDTFIEQQSNRYIDDVFGGSLPHFITALLGGRKLSSKQAEELKRLIDEYEEEDDG